MTLLDLIRLLGRHWKLCVILPIVCALACAGFLCTRAQEVSYSASSRIVTSGSGQLAVLNGAASAASNAYTTENPGYSLSVKTDSSSYSVTISVIGLDSAEAVDAVNEVADTAVVDAEALLGKGKLSAKVQHASSSVANLGPSLKVFAFIALLAGLFLAICIIIGIDAARRPVKGEQDLAESSGLSVLGVLPDTSGELLLANARFASGKDVPHSILVVPVLEDAPAELVCERIDQAVRQESPVEAEARGGSVHVYACAPVSREIASAYTAREADAVLLTAAQWDDSCTDVEFTVRELKLAGANVVGSVLVNVAKAGKEHKEQG